MRVGREQQRDDVRPWVRAGAEGRGALLTVEGEPGAGRTDFVRGALSGAGRSAAGGGTGRPTPSGRSCRCAPRSAGRTRRARRASMASRRPTVWSPGRMEAWPPSRASGWLQARHPAAA
ncbi:hypothetical protein ACFWWM_21590 [Streptomyces sp. NPDC058682]|uniref:hypothetical protein n=1 Tax=Streptomyces sp. NPDC058682 TaxID=3346596 RepID=UPI0036574BB3